MVGVRRERQVTEAEFQIVKSVGFVSSLAIAVAILPAAATATTTATASATAAPLPALIFVAARSVLAVATAITAELAESPGSPLGHDPSTNALIERYRRLRG